MFLGLPLWTPPSSHLCVWHPAFLLPGMCLPLLLSPCSCLLSSHLWEDSLRYCTLSSSSLHEMKYYSGIPIFWTSKRNEYCSKIGEFEKSGSVKVAPCGFMIAHMHRMTAQVICSCSKANVSISWFLWHRHEHNWVTGKTDSEFSRFSFGNFC